MNATVRPSALIDGAKLSALPPALTISVTPVRRSRTKTSVRPFVSPATRLDAPESNATKRPSALTTDR